MIRQPMKSMSQPLLAGVSIILLTIMAMTTPSIEAFVPLNHRFHKATTTTTTSIDYRDYEQSSIEEVAHDLQHTTTSSNIPAVLEDPERQMTMEHPHVDHRRIHRSPPPTKQNPRTVMRLYSGADGQSHLTEMTLAMDDFEDTEGAYGCATPWLSCDRLAIRQAPDDFSLGWHTAPRRQVLVQLQGSLQVTVASGDTAIVGPGDVLLAEDLTGQGHLTRSVGEGPCMYAIVPLAADEELFDKANGSSYSFS